MKIVVIPDIHLKTSIFEHAEGILKDGIAERAVCLMDIPDDWGMGQQIDRYEHAYDRAIAFARKYPDTLWCMGNHDFSYIWRKHESGYSRWAAPTVRSKIRELEQNLDDPGKLNIIHRVDNVLFSHGGLSTSYVMELDEEWKADGKLAEADIDEVISAINESPIDMLWQENSPIWLRPQYVKADIGFRSDKYKQVVGHTPVELINEHNCFISTDVFSTYQDGRQVGEAAMLVIDSETGEWKKSYIY